MCAMTFTEEIIVVSLGEMHVLRKSSTVLCCVGLGSCVCVCSYDPVAKVAGMAHIVLPTSKGREPSPKYADTAIPMLLHEMCKQGATTHRLIIKIAGGAQMYATKSITSTFNIGAENVEMVKNVFAIQGITIVASETGGSSGRTVRMDSDTGKITVTTAGSNPKDL
jgi:chemotaxis protein CheD